MELYYSLNGGEWTPLIEGQNISVSAGDEIRVKNVGTRYSTNNRFQFKKANNENGRYNVEGSITSLVGSEDEFTYIGAAFEGTGVVSAENLILPDGYYAEMFRGCTSLTTAPTLPATNLSGANSCYEAMFRGCTSLTTAPELPATTLASYCYSSMFLGCTSLTTAPELPATTLADYCYRSMFDGCTGLTTAPTLPATNLSGANSCYEAMFRGCTSLTTAPELPATNLSNVRLCYYQMFGGCTSLTTAPSRIGSDMTEIPLSACMCMFEDCTSLTTAPELPATNLSTACYCGMFRRCTSLEEAPKLPATTLTMFCYGSMFEDCTSLTIASSILPSPVLTIGCYQQMFKGCTSLTTAPELPATDISSSSVNNCYYQMFSGCTNLNYIKCLATKIGIYTMFWVDGVASAGTFVKAEGVNGWEIDSVNGIPVGWTVEEDYLSTPLTFIALENGTFKFSGSSSANTLSYSLDNGTTWVALAHDTDTPTVQSGSTIMWKGGTPTTIVKYYGIGKFISSGKFNAKGNIMSLIYGDNFSKQVTLEESSVFARLFGGSYIVNANNLLLPATTLSSYCYMLMFNGCSNLTTPPELPAITLTLSCYDGMFSNCTSLTIAPELPATTLTLSCYENMFRRCSSLTVASDLSRVTKASNSCCLRMFEACTSLVNPPLSIGNSATTLAQTCCAYMFSGCTSLTTAPELPATTLANYCYESMFSNCTSLNYIKCLATNISASSCTSSWVYGVASSGRFVKDASMTGWTTGVNGVPANWTVENAT